MRPVVVVVAVMMVVGVVRVVRGRRSMVVPMRRCVLVLGV